MPPPKIILDDNLKNRTDVDEATLKRVVEALSSYKPSAEEKGTLPSKLAQYIRKRGSSYFPKNKESLTSDCLTQCWRFFHNPKLTLHKLQFSVLALAGLQKAQFPDKEEDVINKILTEYNKGETVFDPFGEYGELETIALLWKLEHELKNTKAVLLKSSPLI